MSKTTCIVCLTKPTRSLNLCSSRSTVNPFCSQKCAALYGQSAFDHIGVQWCETHADWTDPSGVCPWCEANELGRRYAAAAEQRYAADPSKGVEHG